MTENVFGEGKPLLAAAYNLLITLTAKGKFDDKKIIIKSKDVAISFGVPLPTIDEVIEIVLNSHVKKELNGTYISHFSMREDWSEHDPIPGLSETGKGANIADRGFVIYYKNK